MENEEGITANSADMFYDTLMEYSFHEASVN
jgi:hypothetical protein